MQYIGNTYEGVLYAWPTDAAQIFLGVGAQKAPSLGALLDAFPDGLGLAYEEPLPAWDEDASYSVGDVVQMGNRVYRALPDVLTGVPPDEIYDADTDTGGWVPYQLHWE